MTIQQAGEVGAHLPLARSDLGPLADDGHVEVAHRVSRLLHDPDGVANEAGGVGALVAGVGVGKELADVLSAQRPQDRVGDRVVDRIPVGVADRPAGMVEPRPGQDEGTTTPGRGERLQAVQVVAVADPHRGPWGLWRFGHGHTLSGPERNLMCSRAGGR